MIVTRKFVFRDTERDVAMIWICSREEEQRQDLDFFICRNYIPWSEKETAFSFLEGGDSAPLSGC
jgi:hypothetical protein